MGDCLGSPGAVGIGSDIDATQKRVESYQLGLLHWWVLSVGVRLRQNITKQYGQHLSWYLNSGQLSRKIEFTYYAIIQPPTFSSRIASLQRFRTLLNEGLLVFSCLRFIDHLSSIFGFSQNSCKDWLASPTMVNQLASGQVVPQKELTVILSCSRSLVSRVGS